jgi:hypothetical protein
MKSCQTQVAPVSPFFPAILFLAVIFLAAVPALAQSQTPSQNPSQAPGQTQTQTQPPSQTPSQSPTENPSPTPIPTLVENPRGYFGIDFGASSDRFGGLPQNTGPIGDINGQIAIVRGNPKKQTPDIIAGGEVRFPTNASYQSTEFAVFGGLAFHFTSSFTAGFRGQIRKILTPPSTVNGQIFNRDNLELLEIPVFIQYRFGAAKRTFVEVQGSPEFNPHYRASVAVPPPIPNPNLDHAYDFRGSIGYLFGRWYAKGSYGTRYFKFVSNTGNPNDLYNWRTDFVTAGVGVIF